MKRFKYGLNFQTMNMSKFFYLTPISYTEVMPGDTISGTIQSRLFSDTTTFPIMNRAYFDLFAFYIPYRLVWDQFPDFISQADGAPTSTPSIATIWPFNFEKGFTGVAGTNNSGLQRRMYNKVVEKFFYPA